MSATNSTARRAAYRIETDRLVLRCWQPTDAAVMRRSLDDSDAHLRPFIPFMSQEPRSPEQTIDWVRSIRASFDRDETYRYAMFDSSETTFFGEVMLLDRDGGGERAIGYWLDVAHVGHGYAREGASALTRIAFELLGDTRIDLRCVPQNEPSAALARKLGYVHEGTLRRAATAPDGSVQDLMIWAMIAEQYRTSAASKVSLRAFDCLGEQLL